MQKCSGSASEDSISAMVFWQRIMEKWGLLDCLVHHSGRLIQSYIFQYTVFEKSYLDGCSEKKRINT